MLQRRDPAIRIVECKAAWTSTERNRPSFNERRQSRISAVALRPCTDRYLARQHTRINESPGSAFKGSAQTSVVVRGEARPLHEGAARGQLFQDFLLVAHRRGSCPSGDSTECPTRQEAARGDPSLFALPRLAPHFGSPQPRQQVVEAGGHASPLRRGATFHGLRLEFKFRRLKVTLQLTARYPLPTLCPHLWANDVDRTGSW